ncbi:MAG: hypothetical protein ACR2MF_04250 [Chthoniobacterales bacterium]
MTSKPCAFVVISTASLILTAASAQEKGSTDGFARATKGDGKTHV